MQAPHSSSSRCSARHATAVTCWLWISIRSCVRACSTSSDAGESTESIDNAILQWRADELEMAAAEQGLVLGKVRSNEEFRRELQYSEVLAHVPLITVEKIGDSELVPLSRGGKHPLDGIRALGMGHVIAGGTIGRDLAYYGADVLNIWRPNDSELEEFAWDVQVGMRSTILDDSKEDRARFDQLARSRETRRQSSSLGLGGTDTDDPSQVPYHGVWLGLGLLLQSFLTSLLNLLDLSGDEAQPRYIALQLSQCIWR